MIREMQEKDIEEVFGMMRVFYDSPAVLHKSPDCVLRQDIADCVGDSPFIEGYVFEVEQKTAGYAMVAKGYSTEYGGVCIWIEDIYIKPEYRGHGIGKEFLGYIFEKYKGNAVRVRLEVERENEAAVSVYKKCGFEELPYLEMTRELN